MKTFSSFENMRNHNLFPGNVGIERNRMFSLENNNIHATTNIITPGKQESHCTEVRFASFLSSGFITAIVVNPPEKKLAKRTSVHCTILVDLSGLLP